MVMDEHVQHLNATEITPSHDIVGLPDVERKSNHMQPQAIMPKTTLHVFNAVMQEFNIQPHTRIFDTALENQIPLLDQCRSETGCTT